MMILTHWVRWQQCNTPPEIRKSITSDGQRLYLRSISKWAYLQPTNFQKKKHKR